MKKLLLETLTLLKYMQMIKLNYEPEPNIRFGIYNNNNELVKELITDNQGSIKFECLMGLISKTINYITRS